MNKTIQKIPKNIANFTIFPAVSFFTREITNLTQKVVCVVGHSFMDGLLILIHTRSSCLIVN